MDTLDCKGLNCPEPVLRAKAHLERGTGESFTVLVDNEASRENVLRFGRSQGCEARLLSADDGGFAILIVPSGEGNPESDFREDAYRCDVAPPSGNLVYVLSADTMGRGSDELGWALLQTYVATISEVSPLPSHVILYNGGVRLAATEGKALEALQSLEEKGVIIWCCGTCLEYFKIEEERQVGSITNMYDILSTMASAGRVVSPY